MTNNDNRFRAPDALTNFPHLRNQVKSRLKDASNTPLDLTERIRVAHLIGQIGRDDPDTRSRFIHILSYQFETLGDARFTVLDRLLDPQMGYLACFPRYIERLTRYLLDWDFAQAKEHQSFDWEMLHEQFPDLF